MQRLTKRFMKLLTIKRTQSFLISLKITTRWTRLAKTGMCPCSILPTISYLPPHRLLEVSHLPSCHILGLTCHLPLKFFSMKPSLIIRFIYRFTSKFQAQIERPFNDLGVSVKDVKYVEYSLYSKNPSSSLPSAIGKYFGKDGVIVGEARFTEHDKNTPENRMKPSDMVFLQWEKAVTDAGSDVKSLKGFVGHKVVSRSTLETMQKGQSETKQPLNQKAVFKRGDTSKTPEETATKKTAWERMLGTDFISSLNYMLKDHAVALGKKEISEIWCYPRTWTRRHIRGIRRL